jgi:hypothetical protein
MNILRKENSQWWCHRTPNQIKFTLDKESTKKCPLRWTVETHKAHIKFIQKTYNKLYLEGVGYSAITNNLFTYLL